MEIIPKEYYISKTPKQLEAFIETIFKHYRKEGFPYYETNKGYRDARFNELMESDISNIFKDNVIYRSSQGTNLAWSYFPHAFKISCNGNPTAYDTFYDDDRFKLVINQAMRLCDGLSHGIIRGMLKNFRGNQAVSNFRPTAAAALYEQYAHKGVVWDMSGGWGGRLLGAIRANVEYYIATEPATLTRKGLITLGTDYWKKSRFEIRKEGSEVYRPQKNSLSFCFTSPPYFDLEKYSDEKTQSFAKFDSKQAWIDGFLAQTFENCYHGLKKGKYMLINTADPKKAKGLSLEEATLTTAKHIGFTHVNTLMLMLKAPLGSVLGSGQLYKYEPIFCFKK